MSTIGFETFSGSFSTLKKTSFLDKKTFQKHIKKSRVENPQVLSHLLFVVAIFPLPHPCAIRFPRSKHQIPTSPISSRDVQFPS